MRGVRSQTPEAGWPAKATVPGHLASPPARRPRLLRGRLLVLDDHENLCGGPDAPTAVSGVVWQALTQSLGVTANDSVILGLSGFGFKNLWPSLPVNQVQLLFGSGRDGADRAIIEAVDLDHTAQRYDSVAIASGDHIFAPLAWRLRDRGLLVCNVTVGGRGCSRALTKACQCHVRLKLDLGDHDTLARLAAIRATTHGYEGEWIGRHVR